MNILFIFSAKDAYLPQKPLLSQSNMQFGISYISAYLRKHGHQTKLLILTKKTERKIIDNCLKNYSPQLICFTAVFSEYDFISKSAKYIKERYPDIYLFAGGPHVSLNPEDCIKDSFDAVCIGEGEEPTLELVEQLQNNKSPRRISNLWIKNGGKIERNSTRSFVQNLDALPFPDRKMWQEWIVDVGSFYPVLLGRGCPFMCTYCSNHALKKIAPGNYVRLRSTENIIAEVKHVINESPCIKELYLEIETFGINKRWAIDLCSTLEAFNVSRSQPLSFGVNIRVTPNMEFRDLFAAMNRSNFKFINIGLESGSEKVRREVLNRHYSNEDIINAVKLAKKHDLKVTFQILEGIPGETLSDFKETIKVTRSTLPDNYCLNIFFPYPGTELHRLTKEKGLMHTFLDTDMERTRAILDLPGFTKKQIMSNYVWFDYNVYKGYKPLYQILDRVITLKLKSNPFVYRMLSGVMTNPKMMSFKNKLKGAVHKNLNKFS